MRQNALAVILAGNHRLTPTLRQLLESTLQKFADDYTLHIWVQESESYPPEEWEEGTKCTFNYVHRR